MTGFDLVGLFVVVGFTLLDALRGFIRILGGLLAFLAAVAGTYLLSSPLSGWLGELGTIPFAREAVTFFLLWLLGLFLFPYVLQRIFYRLTHIEEEAVQAANEDEANPKDVAEKVDEEIHKMAEEVKRILWDHLLGGLVGFLKGSVVLFLLLVMSQVLPFSSVRDKVRHSLFGQLYWGYFAPFLEEKSIEMKLLHNAGEVIELARLASEDPKVAREIEKDPVVRRVLSLPEVRSFLQRRENFFQWALAHPWEALRDPEVQELLKNPNVQRELRQLDLRKLRRRLKR